MDNSRNTIYLVRHGESMGNIERKLLYPDKDLLTAEGEKQAKLLGEHLSEVKFTKAFSSDFPRALNTARAILAETKHDAPELKTDTRIRERYLGEFENRPYKDAFRGYQLAKAQDGISSIFEFEFDGETVAHVGDRMLCFLKELCNLLDNSSRPETVLIVSHSFAIVTLMNRLMGPNDSFVLSNWNQEDFKIMKNATYMEVLVEKKTNCEDNLPRNLEFKSKHVSDHLKQSTEANNGVSEQGAFSKFTQVSEDAKEFSGCVQQ